MRCGCGKEWKDKVFRQKKELRGVEKTCPDKSNQDKEMKLAWALTEKRMDGDRC